MAACGVCLAFDDLCCHDERNTDRFTCTHSARCDVKVYQFDAAYCAFHDRTHILEMCEHSQTKGAPMSSRILEAWRQLDDEVDEIMALDAELKTAPPAARVLDINTGLIEKKARARGKAEILALLMPAPFDTADAISTEAGKRKWYRDQGETYQTPGLPAESKAPGWYRAPDGGFTAEPGQARTS